MKPPVLVFDPAADKARKKLRRQSRNLNYEEHHSRLSALRAKFPYEVYFHAWIAAIHGDYGQVLSPREERRMKAEAVKLLRGISFSPLMKVRQFAGYVNNEICYHSGDYLGQYRLGLAKNRAAAGSGWFSIGVGAAEHARARNEKADTQRERHQRWHGKYRKRLKRIVEAYA